MNTYNFTKSYSSWLEEYKKDKNKIWIRAILSNLEEIYLIDYNEWLKLKLYCQENKLSIDKIGLQYRSHSVEINTENTDGVYLVKSLIGSFGESNKHTFTIGKLYGNKVKKTMWITPELIEHLEDEDLIDNCFEEAIIYNYGKEK